MSPSYSGNAISGWSNHSGMVTAHGIDESKIGNRVSKSSWTYWSSLVKEQRVYGNCCNDELQLRCTLMAPEKGYPVKIPSKLSFDPWFLTGFTDAEGSFILKFNDVTKPQLEFSIALHISDNDLLHRVYTQFGVGNYRRNEVNKTCVFSVVALESILNVIIPHFDSYPLQTKKRADYLLFRRAAMLMSNKKENLNELVSIRASMNWGLRKGLKEAYSNIIPVERPEVNYTDMIYNPHWLVGFVSGDGCFFVGISACETTITKFQVRLRYIVSQHKRDIKLLEDLRYFFLTKEEKVKGKLCGSVSKSRNTRNLEVSKFSDIYNRVIPFFKNYPVQGLKYENFIKWVMVGEMMKQRLHVTHSGLTKIRLIKSTMNKVYIKKIIKLDDDSFTYEFTERKQD